MANDLNQCNFTGRLGRDVEIKYTAGGTAVANISIAVGGRRKNNDQWEDTTTWVPIVLFGKKAELAEKYLSKGSHVRITGKFQVQKWQDNDGKDRYNTEIIADDMQFIGGKQSQGGGQQQRPAQQQRAPQQQQQAAPTVDSFDEDIPF